MAGWIWLSDDDEDDAKECDCEICLRIVAEGTAQNVGYLDNQREEGA